MKSLFEHVETVRGKPHHERRRFALGASALGASLIGALWLGASLASGAFAIQGGNFAEATGREGIPITAAAPETGASGLAGVAGALDQGAASAPAHIEIIDAASSSQKQQAEQTIIPF